MKLSILTLAAALSMQIGAQSAFAQHGESKDKQPAAATPQDGAADMMAQYAELSEPGYEHKLLDPFVGSWDVKATMWMEPGAPALESTAKAKIEWIMDGRYQRMTYNGEFMGQKFSGESVSGFNKVTGKYFGTWIDTMNTAFGISYGSVDAAGSTFTYHGEYDDAMTGGKMKTKEIIQIKGPNEFSMTAYTLMDDGSEFKHMMLEYKRTK